MTNDSVNDPMAWATAMQSAQKEILRQWSEMNLAWTRTMDRSTASESDRSTAAEFTRRFMTQFEQYLGVSTAIWNLMGKAAAAGNGEQQSQLFTDGLNTLQHQFASIWATTPFGAPPNFASPLQGTPGAGFLDAGLIQGFAEWPALGPAREHQESWQRCARAAARVTRSQIVLAGHWNQILADSLKDLNGKMSPRFQQGGLPKTMKEIYDLWVDSAESAYARSAHGMAFMQSQTDLGNALSELRIAQRELIEEWGRQFDLPTRTELNTLHQQVKELKAALQKLSG